MSRVAIIPARGGSKRIPKKNIKIFHNKPIIGYSIETALNSKLFDDVVVSTDDAEIAEVAKHYGASVPFIRPSELSDDFIGTAAVVAHAIDWLKQRGRAIEYACTIYATAPFLTPTYLEEAFRSLQNSSAKYAFACTSMPFPVQRTFKVTPNNRCEMFWPENLSERSQDLEVAYQDAGQFYFNNLSKKSNEPIFGADSIPIVLPRHLVQDIDDMEDWLRAEMMYQVLKRL